MACKLPAMLVQVSSHQREAVLTSSTTWITSRWAMWKCTQHGHSYQTSQILWWSEVDFSKVLHPTSGIRAKSQSLPPCMLYHNVGADQVSKDRSQHDCTCCYSVCAKTRAGSDTAGADSKSFRRLDRKESRIEKSKWLFLVSWLGRTCSLCRFHALSCVLVFLSSTFRYSHW